VQHLDDSIEDIAIVRGEIPLLTVSRAPSGIVFKDRYGDLVVDLAYIRIARINPNTPQEVRDAVYAAEENNVKGIIFDVRSNPGGLLNETVEITDMFIDKGMIYSASYRDGTNVVKEASNEVITNLPIVILQDSYSASGAELFAAALKENDRAIVIGETSYGKGSVNNAFPLSNGGALYTTIARWFTPDGNLIEKEGITPDVVVRLTLEDFESGIERYKVLWAGIDLLREQIASE
jgi:carboxyl-terminal processing protease